MMSSDKDKDDELDRRVTQYAFDFFLNGGVPEEIYTVVGPKIGAEDWKDIKKAFDAHIGLDNLLKGQRGDWS